MPSRRFRTRCRQNGAFRAGSGRTFPRLHVFAFFGGRTKLFRNWLVGPVSHPWRYIAVTSSFSVYTPSAQASSSSHSSHSHSHVVNTALCRFDGFVARIASYSSSAVGGCCHPQQTWPNRPVTVTEFRGPASRDLAYHRPRSRSAWLAGNWTEWCTSWEPGLARRARVRFLWRYADCLLRPQTCLSVVAVLRDRRHASRSFSLVLAVVPASERFRSSFRYDFECFRPGL